LGLAVLLTVLGPSCRRTSPPAAAPPATLAPAPVLGAVTLHDATAGVAPVDLDLDALAAQLRAKIIATGLFSAPAIDGGGAPPVVRLRGEVALDGAEVDDKGVARAAVRLKLDTRPSEAPGAIEEELAGQGEQIYPIVKARLDARHGKKQDDKQALFAQLVLRVAGDLIDGFAAREKLRNGSAAAIHAALRQDGGDLQEQAIHIAGERKLRDEVPVLLDLLNHPSEPVRDAALGALIQIGDRRAVTALTKSRSLRDRREMRKIIEAIATLGGDEALDYLSFIAASHDDEEIRGLATAAKARLERHGRADAL
jgi:hypothetical protein